MALEYVVALPHPEYKFCFGSEGGFRAPASGFFPVSGVYSGRGIHHMRMRFQRSNLGKLLCREVSPGFRFFESTLVLY